MAFPEVVEVEVSTPSTEGLDGETADLTALLETLKLLKQFQNQMNPEDGICRDEVKALMDTCQVGLDERYPLQSFTVLRSPQNYQAVTESIIKRTGEVVAEFFKKVLELIKKGLEWLGRAIKAVFSRGQHTKETVDKLAAVVEANAVVEPLVKSVHLPDEPAEPAAHEPPHGEPIEGPQGSRKQIRSLTNQFHDAEALYHGIYTGLASALLSEKEFVGQIKYLGLRLPDFINHVERRMDAMITAFRSIDDKAAFMGHLNAMASSTIDPTWFHGKGGEIPELREASKSDSFGEYMAELESLIHRLQGERPHEAADWHVAAKVMINADSGFADPFILMPDKVHQDLAVLENRVVRMSAPATLDNVFERYPDVRDLYNTVVDQITDEFYGLMRLMDAAVIVTEAQTKLAMAVYNLEVLSYHLNLYRAELSKDAEIVKKVNEVQKSLRAKVSLYNKRIPS